MLFRSPESSDKPLFSDDEEVISDDRETLSVSELSDPAFSLLSQAVKEKTNIIANNKLRNFFIFKTSKNVCTRQNIRIFLPFQPSIAIISHLLPNQRNFSKKLFVIFTKTKRIICCFCPNDHYRQADFRVRCGSFRALYVRLP